MYYILYLLFHIIIPKLKRKEEKEQCKCNALVRVIAGSGSQLFNHHFHLQEREDDEYLLKGKCML